MLSLDIVLMEWGERLGIVVSRKAWLIALFLKFTLSYLTTRFWWADPLTQLGWLHLPASLPGVQDSRLYYQLLIGRHQLLRLLRDGSTPLVRYSERDESFVTANFLTISREWPTRR